MIISAYYGMGKTWIRERQDELEISVCDCDCRTFNLYSDDDFVHRCDLECADRYIEYILYLVGRKTFQYIFISTHEEVRFRLWRRGIEFAIAYPSLTIDQDEYFKRFSNIYRSTRRRDVFYRHYRDSLEACMASHAKIHLVADSPDEYLWDLIKNQSIQSNKCLR